MKRNVHREIGINWLKTVCIVSLIAWAVFLSFNDSLLIVEQAWLIVMPFLISAFVWLTSPAQLIAIEYSYSYEHES